MSIIIYTICGAYALFGSVTLYSAYRMKKESSAKMSAKDKAIDEMQRLVDTLESDIREYTDLCRNPDSLYFTVEEFNDKDTAGAYAVIGRNKFLGYKIILKAFRYNNRADEEEKDFARREAEELLEKLKEK